MDIYTILTLICFVIALIFLVVAFIKVIKDKKISKAEKITFAFTIAALLGMKIYMIISTIVKIFQNL